MIRFGDRQVTYHFEPDNGAGRLLLPRSTPFWIALGVRLVDFFGGTVDYSDCDSVDVDYQVAAKSALDNGPTDGEAWNVMQQRIIDLKPLSRQEIEAAAAFASYPTDDYGYRFDSDDLLIRQP